VTAAWPGLAGPLLATPTAAVFDAALADLVIPPMAVLAAAEADLMARAMSLAGVQRYVPGRMAPVVPAVDGAALAAVQAALAARLPLRPGNRPGALTSGNPAGRRLRRPERRRGRFRVPGHGREGHRGQDVRLTPCGHPWNRWMEVMMEQQGGGGTRRR
jgi:hypothetical protein